MKINLKLEPELTNDYQILTIKDPLFCKKCELGKCLPIEGDVIIQQLLLKKKVKILVDVNF